MFGIAAALLIAQAAGAAPVPPAPCGSAEHGAFDFWIGEWDVYRTGTDTQVARSLIEKLYAGCAIRENWMPLRGAGGGSLSGYDPARGRWHQTWFGAAPGPVFFEGGPAEGAVVLTGWWPASGPGGADGLTRMTYSKLPEGAVRQHGEFSADHGITWVTTFDFEYRPRPGE